MKTATASSTASSAFPATRWSVVLAATRGGARDAADALETLCRAYWPPLYAYARRAGRSPHDAQDLTQEFFRRFLEKQWLGAADSQKGRLRTFLIVAFKRFLAVEWRRASAQRRGGGQAHLPLDTALAESRYVAGATTASPTDELYERQWALTLLELTLTRLRAEWTANRRPDDFDMLKDCLMAAHGGIDYAAVATRLGASEGAARVTVHRLRKRFREIYREEIGHTLTDAADVESEVRHLAAALAGAGRQHD